MKQLCALLAVVYLHYNLPAQEPLKYCGTDDYSYEMYVSHPELRDAMEANRAYLKEFTRNYIAQNSDSRSNDSLYTIPVVFHIIHTYGTENVTDEQVMSGLSVLNRNFSNQHPDSANIVAAFKPIVADCQIEFKLAHLDPQGNCTSGINRIASGLSKYGNHSVKDLIHWDPAKYLNVYVVKQIPNLAGHCLMPDQAAAKPEWDGIVIAHNYLGNIGTSTELTSVVMAHEAGHYLNLFHIWGGNNVPGYFYQPVGQAGNCGIGDDVQDTPETTGWSNCNLNAASCGNTVDMVQNAMDYSYCNFSFTQGQRQRMRAALNSSVAGRNNLMSANNLAATGVDLNILCKASFTVERTITCIFDTLQFTDKSITTPDSWWWNFGDGETSTAQHPWHMYQIEGDYHVTLTATKGGTTVSSDSVLIRVNSTTPYQYFVQDFESVNNMAETALLNESDNPNLLCALSLSNQGYNSDKAAVVRMNDTTFAYSGRTVLTSPNIDLSNAGLAPFSFRYAYSQKVLNNTDDALEVFISNDCGKTWLSKGKRTGANLRTVSSAITDANWSPADSLQWKTYSFTIPSTHAVSNFMFRIELKSFYGNAFCLDNININPSGYNSIEKSELENIEVVPNPTTGSFKLAGDFDKGDVLLLDVNGRVVMEKSNVVANEWMDVQQLPKGIYLLKLENDNAISRKKLIRW